MCHEGSVMRLKGTEMSIRNKMNKRGFTLIEILIVIVIIAVLALIVIPRLMSATRKAREVAMRRNLSLIRQAVQRFQADTGVYPASLPDLVTYGTPYGWVNGEAAPVIPGTFKGPYLVISGYSDYPGIPLNPFDSNAPPTVATYWDYNPVTGNVNVNSAIIGTTVQDNTPYAQL